MRLTRQRRPLLAAAALAFAVTLGPVAAQQAQERIDLDAIYKIKQEGFTRSQVMDLTSWLTDVYGPRVTNSPSYKKAGEWAVKRLTGWGLTNVKLEPWGPFGRGWSNDKFYAQALEPTAFPIIGYSKAWSNGTGGLVAGEAIAASVRRAGPAARPARAAPERSGPRRASSPDVHSFSRTRGVLAIVDEGSRGESGTVFVQGAQGVSRGPGADAGVPQVTIAAEHYGRLMRAMEKKVPVRLEMDIRNTFYDADANTFNVVGDIAGTDKADEVVILGGHFDSWQGGTGATDNAAGSAVMMEAMRILTQSGLKLRRTVRIALWGGEEQGLLGSRAYVTQHFADRQTPAVKPEHAKLAAYFNVDNGTGAIRGIYTQGNEAVVPIFEQWIAPFRNLGMTTVTVRDTTGTDHQSFDAVGLPGFQFIQDEVDYTTRTHHSNMDVYERIQEADMRQNAVVVAAFAYNAANRDEKLPRKPLPKPVAGR